MNTRLCLSKTLRKHYIFLKKKIQVYITEDSNKKKLFDFFISIDKILKDDKFFPIPSYSQNLFWEVDLAISKEQKSCVRNPKYYHDLSL